MKLFNRVNAHKQFLQLIRSQDGIICKKPDIYPFRRKACVWFDETVFHIYAQYVHEDDNKPRKKDLKCIKFLINVWIKFPDNTSEETALNLEEYLNHRIRAIDNKCHSYIGMGKTLLLNHMWSEDAKRPHLIYTFAIQDFPVRSDIVEVIKDVLRDAQDMFKFSYSDSKKEFVEQLYDSKKHILIPRYLSLFE